MKLSVLILAITLTVSTGALYSQDDTLKTSRPAKPIVEFFKEKITLSVTDSLARVECIFYFRNNTKKDFNLPIIFPFYVDSLSLYPDFIEAYIIDKDKKQVLYYTSRLKINGISLHIPLKAGRVTIWYLDYEQKIKAKHATYIITTTAAWNKPLEEATYYFVVPESYTDAATWPEADTVYPDDSLRIYKCYKKDFMPEQDMEIFWK